jgi:hypothetical protein
VSYKVTEAFIEHSRSKHGARTVGLIIAEVAHHDGVGWLRIEPTKAKHPRIRAEDDQDNIVFRTKLSAKQVRRCIDRLQDLDEIEVVRAWDGRSRYYVYRLIIDPIRRREVDYQRGGLKVLEAPFWTPEQLDAPLLERPRDGHEFSPTQRQLLGLTSAQYVPSSAGIGETPPGDNGSPDEQTSAPPPYKEPVPGPVLPEEANASSVAADAAEHASSAFEISLALSAQLGVDLARLTRLELRDWQVAIADLANVGATAADVAARCAAYRSVWPAMRLTPFALVRHWSMLGAHVELQDAMNPLERWLEIATQFERADAHAILDDRPGLDEATRASYHRRLDELFDEQREVA